MKFTLEQVPYRIRQKEFYLQPEDDLYAIVENNPQRRVLAIAPLDNAKEIVGVLNQLEHFNNIMDEYNERDLYDC